MNRSKYITTFIKILIALVFLYPVVLILLNSFKPYSEIINNFLSLPSSLSFQRYFETWSKLNFTTLFSNTALYTVSTVVIVISTSSIAGYMLARTKTSYSKILYLLFIIPLMLPFHSFMITMTRQAALLGFTGNRYGYIIILSGLFVPLATFLISRFMINIPIQMEECAKIDGASTLQIFIKIIFPLLNPVIITVVVIDSIAVWNEFIIQLLIIGGKKSFYNIPNGLYAEFTSQTSDWEHALPGIVISLIPIIVFYIFMQRQIVSGITSGAVKT